MNSLKIITIENNTFKVIKKPIKVENIKNTESFKNHLKK